VAWRTCITRAGNARPACPGDPTALWLFGHARSASAFYSVHDAGSSLEKPHFVPSVATNVPIARTLAGAAIVMTASMLIPVAPLDGAGIASRRAGIVGGLALAGGALFLVLGLA
jgi:Zn-dependent protease